VQRVEAFGFVATRSGLGESRTGDGENNCRRSKQETHQTGFPNGIRDKGSNRKL